MSWEIAGPVASEFCNAAAAAAVVVVVVVCIYIERQSVETIRYATGAKVRTSSLSQYIVICSFHLFPLSIHAHYFTDTIAGYFAS